MAGAFGLFLDGSTINIMTLGGFALAIGRLVDDSVVVLENINRHLDEGKEPKRAARDGAEEVALPVLASYLVAMTIIPIYCARFLTGGEAHSLEALTELDSNDASADSDAPGYLAGEHGFFAWFNRNYERLAYRYERMLSRALDHKIIVIGAMTALFVVSLMVFPLLGTQLFPTTDAGKFNINFRAPLGSRLEVTEALARRVEAVIRKTIPRDELDTVVSNLGLAPSISAIYSANSGQDTGQILVSLKPDHRGSTFAYMDRIRRALRTEVPDVHPFFESGSIIDAVLSFGAQAPIDVQVSGPDYKQLFTIARTIQARARTLPQVSETFIPEETDYPTLDVRVDRLRAGRLGLTEHDVITNVITALTSNQMIKPSIWIDRSTGNDYYLTAQYRERAINSLESLLDIPVLGRGGAEGHPDSVLLRNIATLVQESHPAEADHYNIQRTVDVLVNPATDDLGGTQTALQRALAGMQLPRGYSIHYRGSVSAMKKSFSSFGFGISLAIVLLYLVMVAQFRSFTDPFIIMFAVPMGLIGVVWTLWLTGTTLNIESFMGIIVMVGIVVSNSILLVDFANQRRRSSQDLRRAIIESARIRMRPILMTALATVVGLLPIALKIGEGSEASAPLARAAAGGLAVSTLLTLFLVPAVYELLYSRRRTSGGSYEN